ncbi:hypothetical protein ABVT39_007698 [Epinephelus coioides]
MPHCAAFGCNFQLTTRELIEVYTFAIDKKRRKQWESACGRTELPKDLRLCSRHFSPDDFEAFSRLELLKELTGAAGYKRRLKQNAVPTIFSYKESKRPREGSEMRATKCQKQEMLDALLCRKEPAPAAVASEGEPSDTPLVMEAADSPPVQSVSVSVQCSPCKSDAETQTDNVKDMSDAACRSVSCAVMHGISSTMIKLSYQLSETTIWLQPFDVTTHTALRHVCWLWRRFFSGSISDRTRTGIQSSRSRLPCLRKYCVAVLFIDVIAVGLGNASTLYHLVTPGFTHMPIDMLFYEIPVTWSNACILREHSGRKQQQTGKLELENER